MLRSALGDGSIRTDKPLEIFSQTTKSPVEYSEICKELSAALRQGEAFAGGLKVHDTICSQVASRHEELAEFAARHDVIVFVSGVSSSNGKVLCELCQSRNPRTHHISGPSECPPIGSPPATRSESAERPPTPGLRGKWRMQSPADRSGCTPPLNEGQQWRHVAERIFAGISANS